VVPPASAVNVDPKDLQDRKDLAALLVDKGLTANPASAAALEMSGPLVIEASKVSQVHKDHQDRLVLTELEGKVNPGQPDRKEIVGLLVFKVLSARLVPVLVVVLRVHKEFKVPQVRKVRKVNVAKKVTKAPAGHLE